MEKRRKIRSDDPNAGKKKKPKGFRAITIADKDYFWMTDGFVVIIKTGNKSTELTASEVVNGVRNSMSHEVVTPYDVKNYIEDHLDTLG